MVIVVDDEDRENEGDLTLAAEKCTPEAIAFIRKYASGVICVPMTAERLEQLDVPQMVARNEARLGTAFTVSVDAREGITTGISAADRARTIALLPELKRFANRNGLKLITVKELIAYRMAREQLVERVASAKLPTRYGEFTVHGYRARYANTEAEHVALTMGDVASGDPVLVRVDSECLTGHVFGSQRCDCREQLDAALALIAKERSEEHTSELQSRENLVCRLLLEKKKKKKKDSIIKEKKKKKKNTT